MKVCTDACVFGASINVASARQMLDIGTGTGLLSLMAAQKSEALGVDAIEIEEAAANQAAHNFRESPFAARLHALHGDIRVYAEETDKRYDLIVSNPPFFQKSSPSRDPTRSQARHASQLSHTELVQAIAKLLKVEGRFVVLLNPLSVVPFMDHCDALDLKINRRTAFKDRFTAQAHAEIIEGSWKSSSCTQAELIIKGEGPRGLSSEVSLLLKEYYINQIRKTVIDPVTAALITATARPRSNSFWS